MKPWIDGQRENKVRREMLYFLKRKSEAFTVELSRHGVKVVTGTFEGAALQSKRHVGGSDADVEMIMLLCGFLLLYETAEELAPPLQLFLCSPISIFSHYETNKLSTTCNFPQPRVTVFLLLFSQCICGIHEAAGLGAADKIIV